MKLHDEVRSDRILLDVAGSDVESVLVSVAGRIAETTGCQSKRLAAALIERENLGSTAVGGGFAIPHCKIAGIKEIYLAMARLTEQVDFKAADGEAVSFLFIVLSPPEVPAAHLQALSQIARVLKKAEVRDRLKAAETVAEIATGVLEAATAEGV